MHARPDLSRFPLALCIAAALLKPATAPAATVFTSESSFASALAPGYYLEDFESLPGSHGALSSPQLFSGGAPLFSYQVDTTHSSADSSLWLTTQGTKAISVALSWDDLVVTLTGAHATAIGGDFF